MLVPLNLPSSHIYFSASSDLSHTLKSCLFRPLLQTPSPSWFFLSSAKCWHCQQTGLWKEKTEAHHFVTPFLIQCRRSGRNYVPPSVAVVSPQVGPLPCFQFSLLSSVFPFLPCLFGPSSGNGLPLFLLLGAYQSFICSNPSCTSSAEVLPINNFHFGHLS